MPLSISFSPSVAALGSDTRVTGFAKSHEVLGIAVAALRERENVVHLLGGRQLSLLLAFLAERVRLDVAVTDSFPATAVSFV